VQTDPPSIQVVALPEFQRNLRRLSKKYRKIYADIQPVIEQLQIGNFGGDRISGIDRIIFKLRVKNSDIKKGKSSGYHLIYEVESPETLLLLTIYSKSEQTDISIAEIQRIVSEFE
jgi:mRNA-degrading endonuclease RelE of RelBE toxin-antitoxin system